MLKALALLLVLGAAGAAAQGSVAEVVGNEAQKGSLTELYKRLGKYPEISDMLGSQFEGTVFAPSDEAFLALATTAKQLNIKVTDELVNNILRYHIAPGVAVLSYQMKNEQQLNTALPPAGPLTLKVSTSQPPVITVVGTGSNATITAADVVIAKAAIHIIDTVLLPITLESITPKEDPMVLALKDNNLTSLLYAIQLAGYEDELSKFNGTLFAPTNEALMAALSTVGINPMEITDEQKQLLQQTLMYHVIPDVNVMAADLENGEELTTMSGEPLTVAIDPATGAVTLEGIGSSAQVLKTDIEAGDAVIHLIDTVLLPVDLSPEAPTPSPEAGLEQTPAPVEAPAPAPAPVAAPPSSATTPLASIAALAASLMAAMLLL